MSPWLRQNPINTPQERHIPIGTIPIQHISLGHTIAWVAPQNQTGETTRLARMVQQAPAMYRVLCQLIWELEQLPRERNEISIYNSLKDAREAVAGLEICE